MNSINHPVILNENNSKRSDTTVTSAENLRIILCLWKHSNNWLLYVIKQKQRKQSNVNTCWENYINLSITQFLPSQSYNFPTYCPWGLGKNTLFLKWSGLSWLLIKYDCLQHPFATLRCFHLIVPNENWCLTLFLFTSCSLF